MSWNKSKSCGPKNVKTKIIHFRLARLLLMVATLLCVIVVASYCFLENSTINDSNKTKQSAIYKTAPELLSPGAVSGLSRDKIMSKEHARHYWEADNTVGLSDAQLRKWKAAHQPPPCYTNTTAITGPKPEFMIFKHASENIIASYLTTEPGESIVGSPLFNDRFVENFLASCKEPILPEPNDTEEQLELKRLMKEVKIDLRNRMANGESLIDIMNETHEETQRLGILKQDIEQMIRNEVKTVNTEQDADDLISAANKLLDEKGIAPIKMSPIITRCLRRSAMRGK